MHILEYIWLDANDNFRSKTKVLNESIECVNDIPYWSYDGSSTGQANSERSEIFLKPEFTFNDPFRRYGLLVFCSAFYDENQTSYLPNSTRHNAVRIHKLYENFDPLFGIEQEYFIYDNKTNLPVGFKNNMEKQGKYYCSIGADRSFARKLPEEHLYYCLKSGIKIGGINAEVAPGQWEYQIGPLNTIEVGDHLLASRYILNRLAEEYDYNIVYHPKPLGEDCDWNGSGCHTNFSISTIRNNNNKTEINRIIKRLEETHQKHMQYYGKDNRMRLSGKHETAHFDKFSFGAGNRGASIRLPILGRGKYLEDRRPASNMDPYTVCSLILETICT